MYRSLLREAEENAIDVFEIAFNSKNIKGLYCDKVIALNSKMTIIEKTCVLAEELGHHYTSHGDIIDISQVNNRKQEVRAKRWAFKKTVSITKIVKAYEAGCRNLFEISEYLEVTEELLRAAFNTYSVMYGKYKESGAYIIYFDPPGVLKRFE